MTIDTSAALAKAEQSGLKLAIKGRVGAALVFVAFYAAVGESFAIIVGIGALTTFIALGLLHYLLIATGREATWHRFAFAAVDATIVWAIASLWPLGATGDLPQIFVFRIYPVAFLREFHRRMAQAVFDHDGTLDDFIGDEVMAVFGTPEPRPDDAARALACAHAMRRVLEAWNAERAATGRPAVAVGIGVHVGTVVVGSTGSTDRLKFAVVGDTVNVASRLQAATRQLGCELAVSLDAMRAAAADPATGRSSDVSLRGHADVAVVMFGTLGKP